MCAILKTVAFAAAMLIIGNSQPVMASKISYPSSLELPAGFMSMKVSDFIKLSAKDFSTVTGKKLSLKERIAFSMLKKNMKRFQKSHPDQTVNDYLVSDDKKKNTWLIIVLVALAVIAIGIIIAVNSIDVGLSGLGG